MRKRCGFVLSALLVLVCLAACSSRPYIGYAGKQLPLDAVAVIKPELGVKIHSVDAKVVDIQSETAKDAGRYHSAVVLPGRHTLGVIPQYRTAIKTVVALQVSVSADQKYIVRHKNVNLQDENEPVYEVWVEEAASGKVVSNRAISRNPFRPVDKSKLSTSHQ